MEDKNLVEINVVIHDVEDSEHGANISGNPFAILATCASIFYNVGLDIGLSKEGMIKNFTEKIEKLSEHDNIE